MQIMKSNFDLSKRRPVWTALSTLYLDTELQKSDIKNIADTIKQSSYSLEQIKKINKYEVFPVLYQNLLNVAGIWDGFDKNWLVDEIIRSQKNRNWFSDLINKFIYITQKSKYSKIWDKISRNLEQ